MRGHNVTAVQTAAGPNRRWGCLGTPALPAEWQSAPRELTHTGEPSRPGPPGSPQERL